MRGKLENDKVKLQLEFYPTSITNQRPTTQNKDVNFVQDWICDRVFKQSFETELIV